MPTGAVFFIGAGPGDPELITVKGRRLIGEADLVLYAGSLVPPGIVAGAKPGARVVDSAGLNLEETHGLLMKTVRAGGMAARVHTGDPSLYGAMREQMRLLDRDGVGYEVVPGVTAAFAAAAGARVSFTAPGVTQTLILTRLSGRTGVPERERLADLARHGSAMAVYLSAGGVSRLAGELREAGLAEDTVVVAAHRVGWPGERIVRTDLAGLDAAAGALDQEMARQTVFLVLPGETAAGEDSKLYDPAFSHGFRKGEE
jgi:precorrin-4/cobalt-precorrin-4 C11-methyltransferase